MDQIQLQIARKQWGGIAPKTITAPVNDRDRKFKFDPKRTLHNEEGELLLRYVARKARGESFNAMIQVVLGLDEGLDLYDLRFEVYDGEMEKGLTRQYHGVFVESFENFTRIS